MKRGGKGGFLDAQTEKLPILYATTRLSWNYESVKARRIRLGLRISDRCWRFFKVDGHPVMPQIEIRTPLQATQEAVRIRRRIVPGRQHDAPVRRRELRCISRNWLVLCAVRGHDHEAFCPADPSPDGVKGA